MNDARKPPAWGKPLNEDDYLRLAQSWITPELADLAMLRRVDSIEGREVIGQKGSRDCAGLLIPYYWPGESSTFNYRVRRDNPEWEEGENGQLKQIRKYLGPPRAANRLYIPPGVTLEQLRDTALPIVIVEGEKKALALWRLANYETETPRFIPIAIAGAWNWRGKVGKASGPQGERIDLHGPIADLSRIEWNGRPVLIVFDADVRTNDGVHWARKGIAKVLASRGARVRLINLINIGDDDNWILCISWLVAACRPTGPFPILILQGEQGSAKSTTVKLLRRIIDPSSALVRTPPRDGRDLLIAATNSWVIAYDNLSGVAPWLSDSLCRLATGGGFSTRELYTDADEVFFDATRPVILNGIDHLAERADLADRALILNLPPIPNENRKDEAQLYADFERHLPQTLGALFTGVCVALARLGQITLDSKPRMADFALWASAAEPAFDFPPGAFMKAYVGNRAEAVHETLEGDPVGVAILGLMESQESWEGTCKQLLQQLERHLEEATKKSREWPKSPRGLSSRLRRLVTFLRELRIEIKFHSRGTNGQRTVTLSRLVLHSTATTVTTAPGGPTSSTDQSVTREEASGGPGSRVADDAPAAEQPSLGPADPNSLEVRDHEEEVAVVTVVAVNSCTRCGPIEWNWVDGAWICPICGEPAHKKAPRSSLQVTNKRRLANDGE